MPPGLPRGHGEEKDTELGRLCRGHGRGSRPSRSQQLLDHVSRHAVEEQGHHDEEQQGQHDLDDEPLVAGADEVFDGFQRVQEPDERRVRAAAGETNTHR